jgi:acetone carboxylase gamma subunit
VAIAAGLPTVKGVDMEKRDDRVTKDNLKLLVEGKLLWEDVKRMIRLHPKDADRFWKYLEVLQEKVPWKEKILLRISDHLYKQKNPGLSYPAIHCEAKILPRRLIWMEGG